MRKFLMGVLDHVLHPYFSICPRVMPPFGCRIFASRGSCGCVGRFFSYGIGRINTFTRSFDTAATL